MSLRTLRTIVVGAFVLGCGRPTIPSAVPASGGYAAVTRDSAVIVFPPAPSASFVLNMSESRTGINDYYWIAIIPHTPHSQSVWFMVDEVPGGRRASVPVEQFVTHARFGAYRGTDNGPFVELLDSIPLTLTVILGRPAIVVHGGQAVRSLFDQRPSFVTFVRYTREARSATDSVAITYR
jgi:hypothetical protein